MQTSEVLNKAADLIEERGWAKGIRAWNGHDREGAPICIEGGLMAALGMKWHEMDYYREFAACPAYRAVQAYLGCDSELFLVNDRSSKERVVETLRATALIEQVREGAPLSVLATTSA